MFTKLLIANRGEIAVRIARACRDLGVSPVVVYSDADRDSLHVKVADQAVALGGVTALESYLDIGKIIDAAKKTNAQAIHPGYGFLAEREEFARACAASHIVFIGPGVEALRIMSTKIGSRIAARAAGVAPVPGTESQLADVGQACLQANEIGYPVMLKASAGGGGKGLRRIGSEEELRAAFELVRGEANSAFGDPAVYLEKQVQPARHIEVQVLADLHGNVLHLGERECSIQRRHQKILEEAPSPLATPELRQLWGEAAVRLARSVGYSNAGTVEFLVDASNPERFYFLEMNTRLQVEHAVTEMVTGADLVCEQIRLASGQRLTFRQEDIAFRGSAIEARINAEDAANNFLPTPGTITDLYEPGGPGIRNESSLYPGYTIPVHYDPMISKLIAWGRDRDESRRRLRRALAEIRIGGVSTNLSFLLSLLDLPEFVNGHLTTGFLEDHWGALFPEDDGSTVPLLGAALHLGAAFGEPDNHVPRRNPSGLWKQLGRPGNRPWRRP